jgi:hypothetical protein
LWGEVTEERPRLARSPSVCFTRLPALLTTATSATTTTAAKAAFRFRTGFVHIERSAVELSSIQFSDRTIRFRVRTHLDKPKSSWLSGIPVRDDVNALYATVRLKQRPDRSFGSSEVEVSYENILHAFSFNLQIG